MQGNSGGSWCAARFQKKKKKGKGKAFFSLFMQIYNVYIFACLPCFMLCAFLMEVKKEKKKNPWKKWGSTEKECC